MDKISGNRPQNPNPIRDLPAASTAASTSQGLEAARSFLIKHFNGDIVTADKVLNQAISAAEKKVGKNLSFDVVKKAILEAAIDSKKPINDPKELKDLEELKPLFPEEEAKGRDPFEKARESAEEAQASLTTAHKESAELEEEFENKRTIEEREYKLKKQEETQKQQKEKEELPKKLFDTRKKA